MTRRIPILSPNEETTTQKSQVYRSLVDGISEAIKIDSDKVKICEIHNTNTYVTVDKKDWKISLDRALNFYIDREEYEECSKIKSIINNL